MEWYDLSDVQAQAILDMQLRRIAALEREKIESEYRELQATIKGLEELLEDPKKVDAEDQEGDDGAQEEARERAPHDYRGGRARVQARGPGAPRADRHHPQPGRLRQAHPRQHVPQPAQGRQGRRQHGDARGRPRRAHPGLRHPRHAALLHQHGSRAAPEVVRAQGRHDEEFARRAGGQRHTPHRQRARERRGGGAGPRRGGTLPRPGHQEGAGQAGHGRPDRQRPPGGADHHEPPGQRRACYGAPGHRGRRRDDGHPAGAVDPVRPVGNHPSPEGGGRREGHGAARPGRRHRHGRGRTEQQAPSDQQEGVRKADGPQSLPGSGTRRAGHQDAEGHEKDRTGRRRAGDHGQRRALRGLIEGEGASDEPLRDPQHGQGGAGRHDIQAGPGRLGGLDSLRGRA